MHPSPLSLLRCDAVGRDGSGMLARPGAILKDNLQRKKRNGFIDIPSRESYFIQPEALRHDCMEEESGEGRMGCLEIESRYQSSKRQESGTQWTRAKSLRQNWLDLLRRLGGPFQLPAYLRHGSHVHATAGCGRASVEYRSAWRRIPEMASGDIFFKVTD